MDIDYLLENLDALALRLARENLISAPNIVEKAAARIREQAQRITDLDEEKVFAKQFLKQENSAIIKLHGKLEEAKEALQHILWIKDCGIDSMDSGDWVNHSDAERDAMYNIAIEAVRKIEAQ